MATEPKFCECAEESEQRSSMQLVSQNDIAEVWKDDINGHNALYARKDFQAGEIICEFGASAILQRPSYLTIQTNTDEHICLSPQFLQYINHSCLPNIFFDIANGKVVCIESAKAGDELTYFYPSTEWEMTAPFQCHCKNSNCLRSISGAASLSLEVLSAYRLSDFIQRQLNLRSKVMNPPNIEPVNLLTEFLVA